MRLLGLDYGSKTVGVALSDELLITAQGLTTIFRNKENQLRRTLAEIEEICREYSVDRIILGFPKNMNNTVGEQAEKVISFKEMLEKRLGDTEIILWDERMTTMSARRVLEEGNISGCDRKKYIDKIAAVFILQSYLDSLK